MTETLAAVDVGTNSLHLVVARTTDGDRFEVLDREKEMVRLGTGSTDLKELTDEAMDRAVGALRRMRQLADRYGAPVRAVATSAVREAENRHEFLERAVAEAGVEVEVVSGAEEARLIHLGVLQSLQVFDERILLCDIGGGSTELVVGEEGAELASTSVKLGAVRLTNRYFPGGGAAEDDVEDCRHHIEELLGTFERSVTALGFDAAVGSSGTIEQVLRIARALEGKDPLRTLNGSRLRHDQVKAVVEAAIDARRRDALEDLPDLDAKRADILLAGTLILDGVFTAFGITEMVVSEYALREGVFLDTIQRRRGSAADLRDVARRSVVDLMMATDEDPGHSEHVAYLALELFDATAGRHGHGAEARSLLEAAALLANVGLAISHNQHHKHSYYVIRNSDRLVGFTDNEIEQVALIARYHRKSAPKASHPEWAALEEEQQEVVRVAAGLLRVAIGLDRSHRRHVATVRVRDRGDRLLVEAVPAGREVDLDLELYAANERTGLLAEALGVEVDVMEAGPAHE